jgi:hypothetical protein
MGWIHADERTPEERFADGAEERQRTLQPGRSPGVDVIQERLEAAAAAELAALQQQAGLVNGTVRLRGDGWPGWDREVLVPGRKGKKVVETISQLCGGRCGVVETAEGVWRYYADLKGMGFRLRRWA